MPFSFLFKDLLGLLGIASYKSSISMELFAEWYVFIKLDE